MSADLIDLAAEKVGGKALAASDEFFAEKENLLKPGRGVFIADKFTDRGKWMDGWESRRKRTPGHDWCVVELGLPGAISSIDVDTNHFVGNYPEHCSLEACDSQGPPDAGTKWHRLLALSPLAGGSQNVFEIGDARRFTHVRLNIYPDGGVARLRVYGRVLPDWSNRPTSEAVDLAAVENGGTVPLSSDMFFGHKENLIMPGRAATMGEGWETKRRRGPGNDWAIVRLGAVGRVKKLEVDTNHFKGNFPESCSLEACLLEEDVLPEFLSSRALAWQALLPRTKLAAHTRHHFESELGDVGPVSHVRLSIYPDGGVSRLRIFGVRR